MVVVCIRSCLLVLVQNVLTVADVLLVVTYRLSVSEESLVA